LFKLKFGGLFSYLSGCLRALRSQNIHHFDVGWASPQVGVRAQGGGYLAGEMGFAAGFVGESVENTEGRWAQTQSVPGSSSGLSFYNRQGTGQKISNGLFVAGLHFEADQQGNFYHGEKKLGVNFLFQQNPARFGYFSRLSNLQ
jgi:hypothetical protein